MISDATGSLGASIAPSAAQLWEPGPPARRLGRGESLYRAGDPALTAFSIDAGLVKLSVSLPSGRERIVGLAGPGDLVGALTPALSGYAETAEALSAEVVVRGFDPSEPRLAGELSEAVGTHLGRLQSALEDGELPVAARLARAILRLGDRFGQRAEDGSLRITLPLTHEHLAGLIGAARETTTLTLSELRQRGLLEGTRGHYRYDPQRLREAAHGVLLN